MLEKIINGVKPYTNTLATIRKKINLILEKEENQSLSLSKTARPKHSVAKEIILWWEKRRLIFNVLIIALSAFLIYSFWDYPMREIIGRDQIILETIIFIFGANLFYTLGWALGIANHYLFKTKSSNNTVKWVLFILGTILSLLWTNFYFVLKFDVLFAD